MIRPIATEEERIRLIRECQQSGLTANEWCRQNGISRNTFHTWLTRLRRKGLIETAATMPTVISSEPYRQDIVKVELAGEGTEISTRERERTQEISTGNEPASGKSAVMEIIVGSIRVKVTNQVNSQLLADTLQMIGGVFGC